MQRFTPVALQSPPPDEGWRELEFGISLIETRVISYLSVVIFLGMNYLCFLFWDWEMLKPLISLFKRFGVVAGAALALTALILYHVLHESLHLLRFPDHGRSDRSLIGIMMPAVFVLYNGPMTNIGLRRCVLAPLVFLSPIIVFLLFYKPSIFTFNLLGLHLTACLGDTLLFLKLSQRDSGEWLWSTGSVFWGKDGIKG